MRKDCLYWGSLLMALAVAAILMFFLGRAPDERDVLAAIPQPDKDKVYLLLSGKGRAFRLGMDNGAIIDRIDSDDIPYIKEVMHILPVLGKAKSAALMVQKTDDELEIYASARYDFDDLESLSDGRIPAEWTEFPPCKIEKADNGNILLYYPADDTTLRMEINGELVVMSYEPDGLKLMESVLAGGHAKADMDMGRGYDAHLEINDAGFISQLASIYDINAKPGNVIFRANWAETDGTGELQWKFSGLDAIMPDEVTDMVRSIKWRENVIFPEPVLFAAGFNIPRLGSDDIGKLGLDSWQEEAELDESVLEKALSGPVVVEMAGKSKFLLFSLPGLMVTLIGDDRSGEELVDLLWSGKWSSFQQSIEPVEGYDKGGVSQLPLSLVAVTGDDMTSIGLMDKEFLGQRRKPVSVVPILGNTEGAVLWLFIDGPGISKALDSVLSVSSLVKSIGDPLGKNAEFVKKVSERLNMMGRISFVVESLEKGQARWENAKLVDAVTN